jgi:hypothetical protein
VREVGLRKRRREAAEREAALKKLQAASPESDKQQRKTQKRSGSGRGRGAGRNSSTAAATPQAGWGWGKGPTAPPIGVVVQVTT